MALPFAGRAAVPLRDIFGYRLEVVMADRLMRDVPDDVVAVLEARARRLGLSRSGVVRVM